ncbi:MAG: DUF99 family protein [Candidatus Thermoplasmatota archaeon]|nr:DUF99 family protein [Candidatus Thermoplasmatota archaeon]MCL6089843.1 DUF99 family protein [Candidatus Thermoplasmatota archaeon]
MKENVRILGIDDGPFLREIDTDTVLTGVLMRLDGTIERIMVSRIQIDGSDILPTLKSFLADLNKLRVYAIVSEGVTFGGFNLIVPEEFTAITGIPYISVTKSQGELDSMISAIDKHCLNPSYYRDKIAQLKPVRKKIYATDFTINIAGIPVEEAMILLKRLMKVGTVPEPVRIAHMISSAVRSVENTEKKRKI